MMNYRMRFICALLAVLCALCVLSGCTLDNGPEDKTVLATVGDKTVSVDDFNKYYELYLETYTSMGLSAPTEPDAVAQMQDLVINGLVDELTVTYQCEQYGVLPLSAEQEAVINEQVDKSYNSTVSYYQQEAEKLNEDGMEIDIEQYILLSIQSSINSDFLTINSLDEYRQLVYDQYFQKYIEGRLKTAIGEGVVPTDKEIQAKYDSILKSQTGRLSESDDGPGAYKSLEELYYKFDGDPLLTVPDGFRRVKHILCVSESDAQSAYAELEAGADFDSVMAKYTTDEDFMDGGVYQAIGETMSVYKNGVDWSDEVKTACLALESTGDYTDVITDDEGSHILYYLSDVEAMEAVPLENYRDEVAALALSDKLDTLWSDTLAEWRADKSLVAIYTERIRALAGNE